MHDTSGIFPHIRYEVLAFFNSIDHSNRLLPVSRYIRDRMFDESWTVRLEHLSILVLSIIHFF